ncbi:hypothetical protein NMY22_g3822 [Coprinellus aureogranulatus]|nr:hypothetical protein NMY22_g3822 [Coprinellus aureogranulatus]
MDSMLHLLRLGYDRFPSSHASMIPRNRASQRAGFNISGTPVCNSGSKRTLVAYPPSKRNPDSPQNERGLCFTIWTIGCRTFPNRLKARYPWAVGGCTPRKDYLLKTIALLMIQGQTYLTVRKQNEMSTISPSDRVNILVRAWYSNVVLTLFMMGVQFLLCLYTLIIFLETPKAQRKGRWPYILAIWALFVLSVLPTSFDAVLIFHGLLEAQTPIDVFRLTSSESRYALFRIPGQAVPTVLLIFLSDALMLFRCYIVCSDARWLTVFPFLLWISSTVTSIIGVPLSTPWPARAIYTGVGTILSAVLNISITAIITVRLLNARRRFLKSLPSGSTGVLQQYTGVVAILIESALPLSVFGLIYAVTGMAVGIGSSTNMVGIEAATHILGVFYLSFLALSPQLIIFRVTLGRSWTGNFHHFVTNECAAGSSGVASGGLEFARSDNETEESHGLSQSNIDLPSVVEETERKSEKV